MTTLPITIGFTESDRANDYCSFSDGYQPGAKQRILKLEIEIDENQAIGQMHVCEAVYRVTNLCVPGPDALHDAIFHAVYDEILAGRRPKIRSLSTGDTVTVGTAAYECASCGFDPVTIVPAGFDVEEPA